MCHNPDFNFGIAHSNTSSEPTVDYASFLSSSPVGDYVNISSSMSFFVQSERSFQRTFVSLFKMATMNDLVSCCDSEVVVMLPFLQKSFNFRVDSIRLDWTVNLSITYQTELMFTWSLMGDGERNESSVPTITKIVTLPYYFIYTSANPQFDFVIDVIAVLQNLSSLIIPLPPEWKWYKYCTRISISYMINKIIHISIRRREQCYCKGISYESIRTVYIPFHFHEQNMCSSLSFARCKQIPNDSCTSCPTNTTYFKHICTRVQCACLAMVYAYLKTMLWRQ